MEVSEFVDCYEILEISPNANSGTIERMFRYLAQRYHPDNQDTGDREQFDAIMAAYDRVRDPGKRAKYDVEHKKHSGVRWKLAEEASDTKSNERDIDIQNRLLAMLYVRRRQHLNEPGLGPFTLERALGCPPEHLEFHLWYLKEKGWIRATDNGMFAITVDGVDRVNAEPFRNLSNKMLTDQRQAAQETENKDRRSTDRRAGKDRRSGIDTRSEQEKAIQGERRSGVDRRLVRERRS